MNILKSLLMYGAILPVLYSCAQTKSVIHNSQAFYTVWSPGNIPVGADGEPLPGSGPKKIYTVYAETASPDIIWSNATVGGTIYTITTTVARDTIVEAGLSRDAQQPVVIRSHTGLHLWRLNLVPPVGAVNNSFAEGGETILIRGTANGLKFEHSVNKLTALYTPDAY